MSSKNSWYNHTNEYNENGQFKKVFQLIKNCDILNYLLLSIYIMAPMMTLTVTSTFYLEGGPYSFNIFLISCLIIFMTLITWTNKLIPDWCTLSMHEMLWEYHFAYHWIYSSDWLDNLGDVVICTDGVSFPLRLISCAAMGAKPFPFDQQYIPCKSTQYQSCSWFNHAPPDQWQAFLISSA